MIGRFIKIFTQIPFKWTQKNLYVQIGNYLCFFFYKCFLFKVSSVNNIDVPEGENKAEDKENCSTLEDDDLQILDNPGSVTNTPTENVRFQLIDKKIGMQNWIYYYLD